MNFPSPHLEGLAFDLRNRGHKIFVPEEHGTSVRELPDEELLLADFIFFDLTQLNHDVWSQLRRICRLRKPDGLPLIVSCSSRIYRGPEFRLLVEKLGARLAYEGRAL